MIQEQQSSMSRQNEGHNTITKGKLISTHYYGPLSILSAIIRYSLVFVENSTKYVKLYALRRATTGATLKNNKEYSNTYCKPKPLLTDNGTQFTTSK